MGRLPSLKLILALGLFQTGLQASAAQDLDPGPALMARKALTAAQQAALNQELIEAVQAGSYARVSGLLRRGADPNYVLVIATEMAYSSQPSYSSHSALSEAFTAGRRDLIELLVKSGARPNARLGQSSVFREAVAAGQIELVRYFLAQGAKAEAVDAAIWREQTELIDLLIRAGADPGPALELAVELERNDQIWRLLDVGARVETAPKALAWAIKRHDLALVRRLLASGRLPEQQVSLNDGGYTPLERSLWQGSKDIAALLIAAGTDLKRTPRAVELAIRLQDRALVDTLLDLGAVIDPPESPGAAVEAAIYTRDIGLLRHLLARGAKIDPIGSLEAAVLSDQRDMVELMLEQGAKADNPLCPLCTAAWAAKPEIYRLLLEHGADIHRVSESTNPFYTGMSPLAGAAIDARLELVDELLAQGLDPLAEPNLIMRMAEYPRAFSQLAYLRTVNPYNDPDNEEHLAARVPIVRANYAEILRRFVGAGVDINALIEGQTPLHETVYNNDPDFALILLEAGANPEIKNKYDLTVHELAAHFKKTALVEVLTRFKSNPERKP